MLTLYGIPYELYKNIKFAVTDFTVLHIVIVSERAAKMFGKQIEQLKIITAHLGNGCSMAAVDGGRSVDTTMGFTP